MARFNLPWTRREKFALNLREPYAAWIAAVNGDSNIPVTPYSVLGLSAVLRSVQVISTTIAGLPLRTYERRGDDRLRVESDFDDPLPTIDGQTPFAWSETVIIHLLLWREAFLWHESRDDGRDVAYRPMLPDLFKVKSVGGKRVFEFKDADTGEKKTVGSEQITYIPGPSLDGVKGHPFLAAARHIFAAAMSGDRTASRALSKGIRLAGILTPGEGEDIDATEGEDIAKALRPHLLGEDNAGDIAFINRRLKLDPWTQTNVEGQWHETRMEVLGEIERLFGMPPHLLADTEKQTSWGTGVAEQNLGLARYTLRGWSDRIEQTLSRRLPPNQFCEYDYKGLLQGTPAQEIELLIKQVDAGLLTEDEARAVMNRPALTPEQKAEAAIRRVRPNEATA